MDATTIQTWITVGSLLVSAGIATVGQVKKMVAAHHGVELTDEELNAIAQGIIDDAKRRKELADADASGVPPLPLDPADE